VSLFYPLLLLSPPCGGAPNLGPYRPPRPDFFLAFIQRERSSSPRIDCCCYCCLEASATSQFSSWTKSSHILSHVGITSLEIMLCTNGPQGLVKLFIVVLTKDLGFNTSLTTPISSLIWVYLPRNEVTESSLSMRIPLSQS
jgi:hypothetical protein